MKLYKFLKLIISLLDVKVPKKRFIGIKMVTLTEKYVMSINSNAFCSFNSVRFTK